MFRVVLINGTQETTIHHPAFNKTKLLTGQVKESINVASGFSFSFLPNNPGHNLIQPFRTLVKITNEKFKTVVFEGRVLSPKETMDDQGKLTYLYECEGELGYLNDSCQRHGEYRNITIAQFFKVMIDRHNKEIAKDDINKRFEVGNVTVTNNTDNVYRYLGYESTMDSLFDKLIDRLGGELQVRKESGVRYLDYLASPGKQMETEIKLKKNLKSIEKEVDPSEIITRLIPLGMTLESEDEEAVDASQARLTIESVNNGIDYIEDQEAKAVFGVIGKSQTWDDITLPGNLLTRGRQFLRENNRVRIKYVLTALDLKLLGLDTDSFEVGNTYPVINPIMRINDRLRVIEKTTDIINPNSSTMTVGDRFKRASEYQVDLQRAQEQVALMRGTIASQSRSIGLLKGQIGNVNNAIITIENTLSSNDLPGLTNGVRELNEAIEELQDIVKDLPIYGPVTHEADGLMTSLDKIKFDMLQNYEPATETMDGLFSAVDKGIFNQMQQTLMNAIERIERLEGGTT